MIIVQLFHGRNHPDDVLDDWGFDGPVLGPYEWFHVTYGSDIKLGENQTIKIPAISDEIQLPPFNNDDLVDFLGSYYGDMSVVSDDNLIEEFQQKIKRTKEVLNTPLNEVALLLNDVDEWVQNFAKYVYNYKKTSANLPMKIDRTSILKRMIT